MFPEHRAIPLDDYAPMPCRRLFLLPAVEVVIRFLAVCSLRTSTSRCDFGKHSGAIIHSRAPYSNFQNLAATQVSSGDLQCSTVQASAGGNL